MFKFTSERQWCLGYLPQNVTTIKDSTFFGFLNLPNLNLYFRQTAQTEMPSLQKTLSRESNLNLQIPVLPKKTELTREEYRGKNFSFYSDYCLVQEKFQ